MTMMMMFVSVSLHHLRPLLSELLLTVMSAVWSSGNTDKWHQWLQARTCSPSTSEAIHLSCTGCDCCSIW